jgi:hypothetical protein
MNTLVPDRLPEYLSGKAGSDRDVAELVCDTEGSTGVTIGAVKK